MSPELKVRRGLDTRRQHAVALETVHIADCLFRSFYFISPTRVIAIQHKHILRWQKITYRYPDGFIHSNMQQLVSWWLVIIIHWIQTVFLLGKKKRIMGFSIFTQADFTLLYKTNVSFLNTDGSCYVSALFLFGMFSLICQILGITCRYQHLIHEIFFLFT